MTVNLITQSEGSGWLRIWPLILTVGFVVSANSQPSVSQQNKRFVDSLISMYRTKSRCSLTGPGLQQEKKKRRLDSEIIKFLNKFYSGVLGPSQIESVLRKNFRQGPWRFDEHANIDSFLIYKGRIRSYGNLEPYVTYVVVNGQIVGTHITFRIRSKLDCLQAHAGEIPDLLYLLTLIERINFPFNVNGWTEYFDSQIWIKQELSTQLKNQIRKLIGVSSAAPLQLKSG